MLSRLIEAAESGRSCIFTSLVETRGSTPQKAGACMLVFSDGSQVGTLGGGCVEAEVKRRAIALLKNGGCELMTFQLDRDYGWDDGLICGGRMTMLVDPIRGGDNITYYQSLLQALLDDTSCTEAVTIRDGDTPSRFLLNDVGEVLASKTSEAISASISRNLRPVAARPHPYVVDAVSYLPHAERCRLIVIGAGHIGCKVAELANEVGFRVCVADDRDDYCNAKRLPFAENLVVGPIDTTVDQLPLDESTFCVIVTRGHNHDEAALFHVVNRPLAYVGMIGSKRKIRLIFDDLRRDGISEEALSRVHAPVGIEIGSQTVPEIAISIVAELIAHRNLDQGPTK
ncbi:MAG: XdhC family protein [Planctomycetaceae bacterium]